MCLYLYTTYCIFHYTKGLALQLYHILIQVAPDVKSLNYGRFWVILTFLRDLYMKPIINNMDMDSYYVLHVIENAVKFCLSEWVNQEGGLNAIYVRGA